MEEDVEEVRIDGMKRDVERWREISLQMIEEVWRDKVERLNWCQDPGITVLDEIMYVFNYKKQVIKKADHFRNNGQFLQKMSYRLLFSDSIYNNTSEGTLYGLFY